MIFDKNTKKTNSITQTEKKQLEAKIATLNAEVASLQTLAASLNTTLNNITSGNGSTVIPVGSGGTSQTTTTSARNKLLGDLPEEVDEMSDNSLIAGVYPDTDTTSGKLSKRKLSLVWDYFKKKVISENIGTGSNIARSDTDTTTIAETFDNVDSVIADVKQEIEDGVTSDTMLSFSYNGTSYRVGAVKNDIVATNEYQPVVIYYSSTGYPYIYVMNLSGWGLVSPSTHFIWKGLSTSLSKVVSNLFINYIKLGNSNGIATLDSNGKLPASQLPTSSRQIVGEIDTSTTHTLPSVSGYSDGNELIVTGAGYYTQSTAFTLAAGKTLTDMEVSQGNKLIAAGYTFTLSSGSTTLGTVTSFAASAVTLSDGTTISLPYASELSATSEPSTVQIDTKVGDEIMVVDGHWIHISNTSNVDSVNGKTGAVVLSASDVSAVSTDAVETTLSTSEDKIPSSSAVSGALIDLTNVKTDMSQNDANLCVGTNRHITHYTYSSGMTNTPTTNAYGGWLTVSKYNTGENIKQKWENYNGTGVLNTWERVGNYSNGTYTFTDWVQLPTKSDLAEYQKLGYNKFLSNSETITFTVTEQSSYIIVIRGWESKFYVGILNCMYLDAGLLIELSKNYECTLSYDNTTHTITHTCTSGGGGFISIHKL